MSEYGLTWEALGVLIAVAFTIGGGLIGWLMKIHSRLADIAGLLKALQEALSKNDAEHARMWDMYDRHERRLDALEQSEARRDGREDEG